jgi:hypothetical protein
MHILVMFTFPWKLGLTESSCLTNGSARKRWPDHGGSPADGRFKSSLHQTKSCSLERITGISADVLCNITQIEDESIAHRMSWMARRQTTRVEDIAYSLMGIFDVSMPLLYGEGEKAFTRLQEEIIKGSVDHSLFAWNAMPSDNFTSFGEVQLTSVFATHPSQIIHSSGFHRRRLDDGDSSGESYSLTNMGVQTRFRLQLYHHLLQIRGPIRIEPSSENDRVYLAVLGCQYPDTTAPMRYQPAIFIQRFSAAKPQFVRIAIAGVVAVHNDVDKLAYTGVIGLNRSRLETVYLCKTVPECVRSNIADVSTKGRLSLNRPY